MYEDLFRKALNIEDPWVLESVDFDPDAKRIDFYLDFAPGTKFDCPVCNKPGCSAYDTCTITSTFLAYNPQQCLEHIPNISIA